MGRFTRHWHAASGCATPCHSSLARIDAGIKTATSPAAARNNIPGLDYDMVFCADDTIIFSTRAYSLRQLLKLTETILVKYGLKLNKDKCVAINMNSEDGIYFHKGEHLTDIKETMYLGNELSNKADIKSKTQHRRQ